MPHDWDLIGRIAVAFGLSFVIGFEREIRKRLEFWEKLRRERGGL